MSVTIDTADGSIELRGAATEATLNDLVKALSKNGLGGQTSRAKDLAKNTIDAAKGAKKLNIDFLDLGKSSDNLADDLQKAGKASRGWRNTAGKLFDAVGSGAEKMTHLTAGIVANGLTLEKVGQEFDGLAKHIPMLGGALGALGGALVGHVANLSQAFDGLSQTGAAFTGNMFEMQDVAARSYLSLSDMVTVVRSNSEALAQFGGSARLGAARFAEMNRVVQQTYQTEFRMLGLGAVEASEMVANFTAMQSRNTMFQTMSTNRQGHAAAGFIKEITLLANLTGQDRKALSAEMSQRKLRADMDLKLRTMDPKQVQQIQMAMKVLTNEFGEGSAQMDAFRTSVLGHSVGTSTMSNVLLNDGTGIGAAFQSIKEKVAAGNFSFAEMYKNMAGSGEAYKEANKGLQMQGQFSEVAQSINQSVVGFDNMGLKLKSLGISASSTGEEFEKALASVKLNESSAAIKDAQIVLEDITKNVTVGANNAAEIAVTGITKGVKALNALVGGDLSVNVNTFKASVIGTSGVMQGLATYGKEAVKALQKLGTTGGTSLVDDVVKTGSGLASSATKHITKFGASTLKVLSGVAQKIPIIGGVITGSMAASESDNETTQGKLAEGVSTGGGQVIGGMIGGTVGAMIGTPLLAPILIPVLATLGSFLGEMAGSMLGSKGKKAGMIGNLFGFEGFAEGGRPPINRMSVVGEKGPEAFIPDAAGTIMPNNQIASQQSMTELTKQISTLVAGMGNNNVNERMYEEMVKFNRNIKVVSRNIT